MKILLITGPSGSGKTYLANEISERIKNSVILHTDNYYKDCLLSKVMSFFNPGYFDLLYSISKYKLIDDIKKIEKGNDHINTIKYNFIDKKSSKYIINNKSWNINSILIIEGIFAFDIEKLIEGINIIKILLTEEDKLCYERRLERDTKYRYREQKEIIERYKIGRRLFLSKLNIIENSHKIINIKKLDRNKIDLLVSKIKRS